MVLENSSSKARLQSRKRWKWRAAYHAPACLAKGARLAKRCASP